MKTNIYDLITCNNCGAVFDKDIRSEKHLRYNGDKEGELVTKCPVCKHVEVLGD